MKAAAEVGWGRLARFGLFTLAVVPYRIALFPPVRSALLRLYGARVGRRTVLHDVRFFNLYRKGFAGLRIGHECFVGDECLLDLAEAIEIQDQATLAERVLILTHTNVGYRDHPLQAHFPASVGPVTVERGAFLGAGVLILPGVRIGACAFVAAGAVVTRDVPPWTVVAGVPAKVIRTLEPR
jgi:acetyltransferase-like isoleucine patch superfamily enzyme